MYTDENNRVISTFMELLPRALISPDFDIKRGHQLMGRYGAPVVA
eukprot:gene31629-39071_t